MGWGLHYLPFLPVPPIGEGEQAGAVGVVTDCPAVGGRGAHDGIELAKARTGGFRRVHDLPFGAVPPLGQARVVDLTQAVVADRPAIRRAGAGAA
jgi:hypothetical protein